MKHLLAMLIGLSVDIVTFLILMIQNVLLTIPVSCKWKDKYYTQIMAYSLVFGQHLAPVNIKSLTPDALHPWNQKIFKILCHNDVQFNKSWNVMEITRIYYQHCANSKKECKPHDPDYNTPFS